MAAYYSVVRYYPEAASGECLNAGVIAFEGDRVACKFVRNWDRLRRFGGKDVAFLRDFVRSIERSNDPGSPSEHTLSEAAIRRMASRWIHMIQLSEPAGSTLGLEALLQHAAKRFLPEPKEPKRKPRDRRAAISVTRNALRDALQFKGGESARKLLKRNESIQGKLESHTFEIAIVNGKPQLAAQAFSFEGQINDRLNKEIRASAYEFDDVRAGAFGLELAVVMLEPPYESEDYHAAVRIFNDKGARIVPESDVDEWAEEMAGKVTTH